MKLGENDKKLPFRVPENYFEEFPDRLARRIRDGADKADGGKRISLPGFVRIGIAASFLLLATIGIFHLVSEEKSADQILSEVPTESLIAYLEESDLTIDEVIEVIDAELVIPEDDQLQTGFIPDDEIDDALIEDIITDYELEFER